MGESLGEALYSLYLNASALHSFIHFTSIFFIVHYVPGTNLRAWDVSVNKAYESPCIYALYFSKGEDNKH